MSPALALALLLLQVPAGAAPSAPPAQPAPPASTTPDRVFTAYVPERVFDTRRNSFIDFETMVADLARADVVLVGEQHDDPNTHRLELALLQGLLRRKVDVIVSLEMFERDAQPSLDAYLSGTVAEEEFLKTARPWPRYATDYRLLVETAKLQHWPVIAANVPRRFASEVAKSGRASLDGMPVQDRPLVARDLLCPQDGYFARFAEQMGGHPASSAEKPTEDQRATTERYYWSQCLKDETMAESIASGVERRGARPGALVHFNGAFHSDFGTGTAERVRRRLSGRRVAIVSMLPVSDLDGLAPGGDDLKRAEYLVYTVKQAPPAAAPAR